MDELHKQAKGYIRMEDLGMKFDKSNRSMTSEKEEPTKPHSTAAEGTQVISVDEGSQIRALTIYQASLGDEFDIDPQDDTSKKGLKPVEKLDRLPTYTNQGNNVAQVLSHCEDSH
ncbi:hypothetical protein JHK84_050257 [Glycine max]|nr:hypothetical protein JHK84_050257 [Glycine max]